MPGEIAENTTLFKGPNTVIFQWKVQSNFNQKAQINENKKKRVTLFINGFVLKDGSPVIRSVI